MNVRHSASLTVVLVSVLLLLTACGGTQVKPVSSSPTPTPTPLPAAQRPTSTPEAVGSGPSDAPTPTLAPTATSTTSPTPSPTLSPCDGLTGHLEVRILVGPAAAVGLETHAVGSIPFTINSGRTPYSVSGGDHISFHDVLSEDDIHYDVSFEADVVFEGTCEGGPGGTQLLLGLEMAWDQVVVVTAEDFHRTYPKSGENAANVTLPLIDGASASMGGGEGMEVVLRLGQ